MFKNKSNFNYIHFHFEDFTEKNFKNEIMKNFKLNTTYSILLKISSDYNLNFKMCGPQIGFVIKSDHDLDFYTNLYNVIMTRIEIVTDNYTFIDKVDTLEIMFSIIIPQEELKLKNINQYSLNQQLISKKEIKNKFNQNLLPLTTDISYYGFNVVSEEKQNLINKINNSIGLLNKNIQVNDLDKVFIYKTPNNRNKYIIISKNLDKNNFLRYIYDYNTGIFYNKIIDNIICKTDNNILFNRSIDNVTLTLNGNKIVKYEVVNKLQPIKSYNTNISDRNINIGTFDLETFRDIDALSKVYALGFKTNSDMNLYYLSDYPNLDSSQLILKCIDDMLVNKYHNFIFYSHNLGHYDIVFMYNVLLQSNLNKGYDYYNLSTTMRDNTIIKLDIKIKLFSQTKEDSYRYIKISFVDSINLLNLSLDKLTKEFNVEVKKGNFPHSFVNKNNLKYKGKKPDYTYYENISINDYNLIPNNNWDLKQECLKYLTKDLIGLFEVMNEFSRLIYIYFNVQITDALTITRLAINIFKSKYYKNKCIPSINKIYLFNFIKEAYFGGLTEIYKPFGKNLAYIDINSLYPFAALNPMPGNDCVYIESFEDKGLDLDNLFGFFYARVKTNNLYLGLLPIHINNRLVCPNGEYSGIWSSEELKLAKSKGYEINVIKGYQFNKVNNIFNDYVLELFNLKKNSTGSLKLIYKSLLNNLLGRFGLNIIKPITQTVNKIRRDYIFSTRKIHSHYILNEDKFLITYDPKISTEICTSHGLDIIKVLEKENKFNIENSLDVFNDVSIATAAFVTSYARIAMNKFKLDILEKGGSIYYSDTDSIVLDKKFLDHKWIGKEIGQFKLEYDIKEAYFISNKTYCLILTNGETIIKTKGISNNSITLEDFKSMYFLNKNVSAKKFNTITNYQKASVLIEKKDVVINYDAYTKREKIYKNGIWVDTKPLNYINL